MHSYRGRGGARQSTPANVQCQKCLKRGHYSYECKAGLQERPYKARPSRTQQLLNPRLAPKLTNDAPDETINRKKGVADEELAKKEAERARKRGGDSDEEPAHRGHDRKRRRSGSVDSVSSISTRSSRSPPPRRRVSPSPQREQDASPPPRRLSRSRSFDSASDGSRRPSPIPERGFRSRNTRRRSPSGRSVSPDAGYQSREDRRYRSPSFEPSSSRRGGRSHTQQRHRSISPGVVDSRDEDRADVGGYGRYRERDNHEDRGIPSRSPERQRSPHRQRNPLRERSLSPFSKRLALTQAMNMGR